MMTDKSYIYSFETFLQIEKLRSLRRIRPLAVTFTGMILSSMDGGHVDNCISIYEHSKNYCEPDIGIINAMLKVYGRNDMFLEAKELYELTKKVDVDSQISLSPDIYTFSSMLEASARALQWEYFESVYKEMSLVGYQLDQKKHAYLLVDASKAGKVKKITAVVHCRLFLAEIFPKFQLLAKI